jgi:hypothetical protein
MMKHKNNAHETHPPHSHRPATGSARRDPRRRPTRTEHARAMTMCRSGGFADALGHVREARGASRRLNAVLPRSRVEPAFHQVNPFLECVRIPPINDTDARMPVLPLGGSVAFRIKPAESDRGRFCAPRTEAFTLQGQSAIVDRRQEGWCRSDTPVGCAAPSTDRGSGHCLRSDLFGRQVLPGKSHSFQ